MNRNSRKSYIYDQKYRQKCFYAWYLGGRPQSISKIQEIIPEIEGRKPTHEMVRKWLVEGSWDIWADDLDARALQKADEYAINKKAKMLREHQEKAEKVSNKALDFLLSEGFDSSASAVQAFFRGMEEQRKTAGFSDLLEKLDKMTNNDVEKEIINLLNRASENDQIIDSGDVVEVENNSED